MPDNGQSSIYPAPSRSVRRFCHQLWALHRAEGPTSKLREMASQGLNRLDCATTSADQAALLFALARTSTTDNALRAYCATRALQLAQTPQLPAPARLNYLKVALLNPVYSGNLAKEALRLCAGSAKDRTLPPEIREHFAVLADYCRPQQAQRHSRPAVKTAALAAV
jgi:hypothetical protein